MMAKKKQVIVVLSPGFPKDEDDTSCLPTQQSFVQIIAEQFPDLSVKLIAFQYPFHNRQYSWKRTVVYPLGGRNKGQLFRVNIWVKAWRRLSALNKEFDIKGIISFWCGECALVGSWFAKFHSLKHLCWISGQDAKKENKYVQWIRPSAYELVAMSDFLQQTFFRNHNIKPVHVIPPGIDERMFNNDAIEKDIDIIGVGSLIPLKQYEVFIEVIGELRKTLPNIKVVICGDGKERKRLQGLINELGLDHNIQLVGEKKHDVVLSLMGRSKILLHTSMYEGFGIVCLEALAAGTYAISLTKPMEVPISNWHQVDTKEQMIEKAISVLLTAPDAKPVLPYLMEDSEEKMICLLSISKALPHEQLQQLL